MINSIGSYKRIISAFLAIYFNLSKDIISFLEENFTEYKNLNRIQRKRINRLIIRFKISKRIIGEEGLEIDDFKKSILSFVAVYLVQNLGLKYYDSFHSIYVFYDRFYSTEYKSYLDGKIFDSGVIFVSWSAVEKSIKDRNDGNCVISHEMAHAIDLNNGFFDGLPLIKCSKLHYDWIEYIHNNFTSVLKDLFSEAEFIVDESELFAYLTEYYIEKPTFLKEKNTNLFNLINRFYKLY